MCLRQRPPCANLVQHGLPPCGPLGWFRCSRLSPRLGTGLFDTYRIRNLEEHARMKLTDIYFYAHITGKFQMGVRSQTHQILQSTCCWWSRLRRAWGGGGGAAAAALFLGLVNSCLQQRSRFIFAPLYIYYIIYRDIQCTRTQKWRCMTLYRQARTKHQHHAQHSGQGKWTAQELKPHRGRRTERNKCTCAHGCDSRVQPKSKCVQPAEEDSGGLRGTHVYTHPQRKHTGILRRR